jgi:PAS domain S-box-containing protein
MLWSDALESLRKRDGVDLVLMITKDESREWFIEFTQNYLKFPEVIITRKDSEFISGIKDLAGRTISLENNFIEADFLRRDIPGVKLSELPTTRASLEAVATGKADAYVGNLAVASYLIEKNGFSDLKIAAPSIYPDDAYAMGVRKDWPELARILDKALDTITEEEQRQINQKWLSVRYEHGIHPHDVIKWVLIVAGIALVFILQLRRMVKIRTAELEQEVFERKQAEDALLESRNRLSEQNDELLATDERLRVQIEEYETSQNLLKVSNQNLQTLFDVSPFSILISSKSDGKICEINRTFLQDFGYAPAEIIGNIASEIGFWEDGATRGRFWNLAHQQNGMSGFSAQLRTKSGEVREALLFSNLIKFKESECLLTVIMDVTEQKRLESNLQQSQKMDLLGQLAGGVAHDFNNMLSVIIGSAQLLTLHVKENDKARKYLSAIQEAATRSADMTHQLLTFSRKGQVNNSLVKIHDIIKMVISLLERTIDKKITLETRLTAINCTVSGDPTLLQNALLNLGVNARDAMPGGGNITFTTDNICLDHNFCTAHHLQIPPGQYLEISVADNGTGIPPQTIERIFEPFFTTKESGKGTGLGLAVVFGTIKDNKGAIIVQSTPGVGTVFKLYLPLAEGAHRTKMTSNEIVKGSGGILLVDDEPLVRTVNRELLENLGYRVYVAENGKQALEIYSREKDNIALVIMDVVMPGLGGKETLKQLIEFSSGVKVLMTSGFHQESTISEFETLGAAGFIKKPYSSVALGKAITSAM